MAVEIIGKRGQVVTLLNPSEKAAKFASELRTNTKKTNRMITVINKNGTPKNLTSQQRAYRAGYLAARSDNAKAFKAKKKRGD